MKKIILITLGVMLLASIGYCGGVTDVNNANKGDILVATGENHGKNTRGEWTDSSFLKGEAGQDGLNGLDGQDGLNGTNGADGSNGIDGVDGNDGKQGVQGVKGDTGANGVQGIQGVAGVNGSDGVNGVDGIDGIDGSDANVTHRYTDGSENKITDYGYNDYYSENAFKNNLINEGYSKVFDGKPSGLDVVEVGYMGLRSNPNNYDADYVLREEYEKYSSQYQDIRIKNNTGDIIDNTTLINKVNKKQTKRNKKQDKKINKNITNINKNKKAITKETKQRKRADKVLQKNINKEEKARIKSDKKLQKNINKEENARIKGDKRLRRNINKVDNKHTVINERQDSQINNNTSNINNNSQRIDDTNNRVSELEETQYRIDAEVQIKDTRNWRFSAFINNDIRHGRVDAVGVKVTYKLGKDYAVKRMDALERKIDTYIELKEQENIMIVPTENGLRINTNF